MNATDALHTTTIGEGPAQVVFLHGLFGQGKNFTTIARAISDVATCTLVDLPNHGRSPWTETFGYDQMAQAVAGLLGQMGEPVCLVGHSMGGKVAMRTALDHPELVARLMVVDISPVQGVGSTFDTLVGAMQHLDLQALGTRNEADEILARDIPDPVVRGFLMQNLRREPDGSGRRSWHWQMNLDLLARELKDGIAGWPASDHVYGGPVMWVAGERSDYIRPEYAPAMRALFPKVITVTIKGAGHWVHSEQPEAFVRTMRYFVTADATSAQ